MEGPGHLPCPHPLGSALLEGRGASHGSLWDCTGHDGCPHTPRAAQAAVRTLAHAVYPAYTHKPQPERDAPGCMHPRTHDRLGKLQRDKDTASLPHARQPLPDRPRPPPKTPTDRQIPQPTATHPANTRKPGKTVLGPTPRPSHTNERHTGHTWARGTGSHGPLPCNTQITRRPGRAQAKDTPASVNRAEKQPFALDKLTGRPCSHLLRGPWGRKRGRREGQHVPQQTCTQQHACTHTAV